MSAETDLRTTLVAAPAVTAIAAARIHWDTRPQDGELPCVVFTRSGTEVLNTIHGTTAATQSTLQVVCIAKTRTDAESLANACASALAQEFTLTDRRADFEEGSRAELVFLEFEHWS